MSPRDSWRQSSSGRRAPRRVLPAPCCLSLRSGDIPGDIPKGPCVAPNNWHRGQTGSPLPGPCPWWSLLSRTWAGGRAGGALLLSLAPQCQTHGDPPEPAFCLPSQLLKIAFDDEVAMESAEVFRKHLHKLRYPQHVHGTFAFTVGQSPKQAMQPKAKEKNPSLRYLQGPRSRGSGRGMLLALAGGAGALLSLLQPTGRAARQGKPGTGSRAGARGPWACLAQTSLAQDPCSLWVFARRGTVIFFGVLFQAEDQPSLGSALMASVLFPARPPRLKQHKSPGSISWEKLHWARERGLCLCGARAALRGSGRALCLVLARGQTLLLRSVAAVAVGLVAAGRAWCALESKLLSRVCDSAPSR